MTTIDRAELMRWNAANDRARREYQLHPIISTYAYCRNRDCPCRKYPTLPESGSAEGETWENEGGPEGASTPESPALDQHRTLRGSASRG